LAALPDIGYYDFWKNASGLKKEHFSELFPFLNAEEIMNSINEQLKCRELSIDTRIIKFPSRSMFEFKHKGKKIFEPSAGQKLIMDVVVFSNCMDALRDITIHKIIS
jgi:hypothetical protein